MTERGIGRTLNFCCIIEMKVVIALSNKDGYSGGYNPHKITGKKIHVV